MALKAFSYRSKSAHADYGGKTFDVLPVEVLGIASETWFIAEKDFTASQVDLRSLLRLKRGKNKSGPFEIQYEGDFITVYLSGEDWDRYKGCGKDVDAARVFHSAVALPVLSDAILNYDRNKDLAEFAWHPKLGLLLEAKKASPEQPIAAAQSLLQMPLQRTLESMIRLLDANRGSS